MIKFLNNQQFSKEMKLLLLTCLKSINEEDKSSIEKLVTEDINWSIFIKMVEKHRVYPIVYENLSGIENVNKNSEEFKHLERKAKRNVMNSVKLTGELIRISRIFEENNISVISIKGPALCFSIYNDLTSRTSKDLDLIVSPNDVEKAEAILAREGYKKSDLEDDLTPKQRKHLLKIFHHFSYIKSNGINIELHWRCASRGYNISFEEMWSNRSSVDISGYKINVLNKEENLLYLIFHGSKHGWSRLRWLCDIVEIVEKEEIKWQYIIKRAENLDILGMLAQTTILINELFQVEIPEELKQLESHKLGTKLAAMAMPLINDLSDNDSDELYFKNKQYGLVWKQKLSERLSFFMLHLKPSLYEFQTIKLKDQYFFLYYILRPFLKLQRIIKK